MRHTSSGAPFPSNTDPIDFFDGHPESQALYRAVAAMVEKIGEAEVRVSKSQIAFHRAHPFAAVWRPGQYLGGRGALLVLTVYLRRHDGSPRWKEVVEPQPGRFTHHLELRSAKEVDDEVGRFLAEAWGEADRVR